MDARTRMVLRALRSRLDSLSDHVTQLAQELTELVDLDEDANKERETQKEGKHDESTHEATAATTTLGHGGGGIGRRGDLDDEQRAATAKQAGLEANERIRKAINEYGGLTAISGQWACKHCKGVNTLSLPLVFIQNALDTLACGEDKRVRGAGSGEESPAG